jgi:hypothetical protein
MHVKYEMVLLYNNDHYIDFVIHSVLGFEYWSLEINYIFRDIKAV